MLDRSLSRKKKSFVCSSDYDTLHAGNLQSCDETMKIYLLIKSGAPNNFVNLSKSVNYSKNHFERLVSKLKAEVIICFLMLFPIPRC